MAREYAGAGKTLILQGRDDRKLAAVTDACEAQGASVMSCCLDLTDIEAARSWMSTLLQREEPDLVVLNAGMNTNVGPDGAGENWDEAHRLIELNLVGVMALADLVAPEMRARGRGQLVLVSSLAAYFGLPVTPSYCASKAGIKAYGEALRGWLADHGVKVNVVMPGYVSSPMCDAMPGPKPFILNPDQAAVRIRRGLERNRARIAFPFWLAAGMRWLSVLPVDWALLILRRLGYRSS